MCLLLDQLLSVEMEVVDVVRSLSRDHDEHVSHTMKGIPGEMDYFLERTSNCVGMRRVDVSVPHVMELLLEQGTGILPGARFRTHRGADRWCDCDVAKEILEDFPKGALVNALGSRLLVCP